MRKLLTMLFFAVFLSACGAGFDPCASESNKILAGTPCGGSLWKSDQGLVSAQNVFESFPKEIPKTFEKDGCQMIGGSSYTQSYYRLDPTSNMAIVDCYFQVSKGELMRVVENGKVTLDRFPPDAM